MTKVLLTFLLYFSPFIGLGVGFSFEIDAEGVVIMNAKTGAVLFEKNAHMALFPASTTKVASALYVISQCRGHLKEKVTAQKEALASITPQAKKQSNYRSPSHWLETDGSHIGIKRGEEFILHDLLRAMLISSANDASNVIAQHVGGSIPKFMGGLNQFLERLGCKNTFFNNPHGLHHPEHLTTPYDLALMVKEGLKDPIFREIIGMSRYVCPQTNLEHERTFKQTNLLLRNGTHAYSKVIGGKTGTTQAAGKNLVVAAQEADREIILVLMGYRAGRGELYQEVIRLFETVFKEKKMRKFLLPPGDQSLSKKMPGARGALKTYLPEGLYYDFYPSEEEKPKVFLKWKELSLPILEGAEVASLEVQGPQGAVYHTFSLFAKEELRKSVWYLFLGYKKLIFGLGVGFLLLLLISSRKKSRHLV